MRFVGITEIAKTPLASNLTIFITNSLVVRINIFFPKKNFFFLFLKTDRTEQCCEKTKNNDEKTEIFHQPLFSH